jgi:hypothetical protein
MSGFGLTELAKQLATEPGDSFRVGQVVGYDFAHRPPVLFIDDDEHPMRFLGEPRAYALYDSVIWVPRPGAPLVLGRLAHMGGDLEDWHLIGVGSEPAFANSWTNFGGAHAVAGFYKTPDGWIRLKGLVSSGTSTSTMFTLPDGYRPPFNAVFTSVSNNTQCVIQIDTSGNVSKPIGGSNTHASLNGITFPAADWNRTQWLTPAMESAWNRSSQPNPTVEIFLRDDGWIWVKGIIDGTLNTRMFTLPEDSRVLFDHIMACVDIPAFAFNRVNLSYKGVLAHAVGAANVNLGGKNWFANRSTADWVAPGFLNSWANLGTTFENAGYYLDHMGVVHLQGNITGANNSPIFNLPAGFRPLEQLAHFSIAQGETVGRVDVLANGDVQRALGSNGYLALTGISFRAEQ